MQAAGDGNIFLRRHKPERKLVKNLLTMQLQAEVLLSFLRPLLSEVRGGQVVLYFVGLPHLITTRPAALYHGKSTR